MNKEKIRKEPNWRMINTKNSIEYKKWSYRNEHPGNTSSKIQF